MITVSKQENGVLFTFQDSDKYLYGSGTIEVPFNSLSIIQDESDMITLRKSASNDIFISARYDDMGYASKEEAVNALKEILYDEAGISQEEVQEMIDAATSGIPSSEVVEQLRRDVNAVSGEVDTKQDILTAGENITISGNVISADAGNNIIELTQAEYDALETKDPEALYIITDAQEINMNDYYTKSEMYNKQEVDASIATKADASALTAVNNSLTAHTANTEVHVTQSEKNVWNGKADASALTAVQDSLSGYVTTSTYESGQYATAQALNALQENKLDASAYTPTDLSEYWTSGQTQNAINAATSGIPSSQVIETLQSNVSDLQVATNDIWDAIDEKEEVIASALTQLNQDISDIDAKEEVIASALTEVRQDVNKKANVCYIDFWGMFNDSFEMDDAKWDEMVEAYNNNAIFYAIPKNAFNNTASPLTVEYTAQDNQLWFNIPWGNGYTLFNLNRIDGEDGYEYTVSDVEEFFNEVDNQLNSGSTNPVQNAVITQALNNKLDASAYTPTDLSEYWTSGQTQNAINAATSGIPSSQVIEQLRTDINTVSGTVDTKQDALEFYSEDTENKLAYINIETNDGEGNTEYYWLFLGGGSNNSGALIETDDGEGNITSSDGQISIDPIGGVTISASNGEDGQETTGTYLTVESTGVSINGESVLTEGNVDNVLNSGSTNPVQNAVITQALDSKPNRNETVSGVAASSGTTLIIAYGNGSAQHINVKTINGQGILGTGNIELATQESIDNINSDIDGLNDDIGNLYAEIEDNEYTVSQAINELKSTKLDASAYTPTDLSQYWTSAQTQTAIDGVNQTLTAHTADTTIHVTSAEKTAWNAKQDALTAGSGIEINGNVISATGGGSSTDTYVSGGTVGSNGVITLTKNDGTTASVTGLNTYVGNQIDIAKTATGGYDDSYVNVSGDTMTGALNIQTANITGAAIALKDNSTDILTIERESGSAAAVITIPNGGITNGTDSAVWGNGVNRVLRLTQAQYDALTTKDSFTLYVIVD